MISRIFHLLLGFNLVLAGWSTLAADPPPAGPRPPNVVIFLADDAGWGDYGGNGNPDVRTPHIDSLARDGVSLKWFFVQPVCAPTRAEFLTGRYHPRSGVRGVSTGQERMDLGERTLAEGFQAAGYATGAFGKWHNGSQWPYHPQARGFDEYFGHTSGHWGEYVDPPLERNGRLERTQGYIVDVCTDAALEFIGRHRDRPFFCYVPFTTPHSPWSVPDEYWRRFRDRPITRQATPPGQEDVNQTRCALAMMENQDDNVGRVLRRLDDLGLRENTIVVYFSDNGPNTWRWNGGMKGRKAGTDDGSVRSPCFIRWPAGLPPGRSVPHIAGAIDLLPTLTALAGVQRLGDRPLDGRDLSPLLKGETVEWPDRLLFNHWAGRISVRTDRHRLDATGRLYDVVADPGQTRNVTAAEPETARRLQEAVTAWRADVFGEGWEAIPGGAVDPRPISVGHPEFPIALLPARDGEPRGGVQRSASAPNSSYFTNWTTLEDRMVWNLEVRTAGEYDVVIDYTCPLDDAGSLVAVEFGDARLTGRVAPGWDPPLYTHQDTLPRPPAESRMKEFRSLHLGRVRWETGRGSLVLRALEIPGRTVAEVRRVTVTLWDSPVKFPERGALPALFPPDVKSERYDPGEPDYYLFGSPERSLAQIRKIQAAMPPGRFTSPLNDWRHLARTRRILTEGGRLEMMAIGDSIVNDTMRSGWVALLREAYPRAEITATVYVRGGGGAQHFRENQRLEHQVFPRRPDLVFLGGISQRSIEDLEALIDRLRVGLPEVEILLGTGAFGTADPRDPAALAAAAHSGTGGYGRRLRELADRKRCAFLDFTTPWAEYLHSSGQHPHRFHRDAVHANEFGEQILARILMEFWQAPALRAAAVAPARSRQPNVLFIAVDDLRNDLGALGVAHARTPALDAFASTARPFSRHYAQVPTCGAARCSLLRGRYPSVHAQLGNAAIRETHGSWAAESLPAVFRRNGYQTLALGKISHHPGGRTGKGWAEGPEELPGVWDRCWVPTGPWGTPEALMHGYAGGVARQPGRSPPWEAADVPDDAYPDAWVAGEAVAALRRLKTEPAPWFFAVGFFKPHLPFAAPRRWHDLHAAGEPDLAAAAAAKPDWPSGWHASGELRKNYGLPVGRDPDSDPELARTLRRAYAASISYLDAQVGRVFDEVRRLGLDRDTVVVVWSDHGFLLGEHAIWGKHCLYEQALRSPLIIRTPGMVLPGRVSRAVVETVDVFPTLADLCGIPVPEGLDGRSLRRQLEDPEAPTSKPALGFWSGDRRTVRTDRWRLIIQGATQAVELFDAETDPDETRNVADRHPEARRELLGMVRSVR